MLMMKEVIVRRNSPTLITAATAILPRLKTAALRKLSTGRGSSFSLRHRQAVRSTATSRRFVNDNNADQQKRFLQSPQRSLRLKSSNNVLPQYCCFLSTTTTFPPPTTIATTTMKRIRTRTDDDNGETTATTININGTIPKNGHGVEVGQYATLERTFTQEDIDKYSELIGDYNPIHLSLDLERTKSDGDGTLAPIVMDDLINAGIVSFDTNGENDDHGEQSKTTATRTTRPLVHGMLVSSLFSAIFGTISPGCVYVNQTFDFIKPIYVDEVVTATLTITRIRTWPKSRRRRERSDDDSKNLKTGRNGVVVTCDTVIAKKNSAEQRKQESDEEKERAPLNVEENDDGDDDGVIAVQGKANVWLPGAYSK